MKYFTILSFICICIGCSTVEKTDNTTVSNGTWMPVREEMNGTTLPSTIFEKQKLVISDSNYTMTAESVDKGIVRCKDGKMDIYGKEGVNAGKHFTAIYKSENDELTICYNLAGDAY